MAFFTIPDVDVDVGGRLVVGVVDDLHGHQRVDATLVGQGEVVVMEGMLSRTCYENLYNRQLYIEKEIGTRSSDRVPFSGAYRIRTGDLYNANVAR